MRKYLKVDVPAGHPAAKASCVFMAAAALLRLVYFLPAGMTPFVFWVHLAMPVLSAVIFLTGMALGERWVKGTSIAAVVLGVLFFIIKAASFTPAHRIFCTLLYLAVLVLFTLTILGYLPTKRLLYPLFGLPLGYHLLVDDTRRYFFADPPVPVREWMPELSVLCIMTALLCFAVSLKAVKYDE